MHTAAKPYNSVIGTNALLADKTIAWNESGGNDKDPWGNRGNQNLPDLDEAIRKLQSCQDYSAVRDPPAAVLKGRLRA